MDMEHDGHHADVIEEVEYFSDYIDTQGGSSGLGLSKIYEDSWWRVNDLRGLMVC